MKRRRAARGRGWALPGLLALLGLLGSCTQRSGQVDLWSKSLPTAKERVARLCAATMCPTRPLDAAYHLQYVDLSGELAQGATEVHLTAVVKVEVDDVVRWALGCREARLPVRPDWLPALLEGTDWTPTGAPDVRLCGREERILHVKDGLVLRRLVPPT